jgi:putative ABC transport system ATP-binding protein
VDEAFSSPLSDAVPPAVRVQAVSYAYGEGEASKPVLFDNNLEILPGELTILSGPSGSGKTTLLSLIGALRAIQEGTIEVGGHDLRGFSRVALLEYRKSLGFIFQHHNLFPALTASESVQMALDLHPLTVPAKRARTEEVLRRIGLGERMDYKPERLSGGQRQRVAIARALVHRPRLLLADEPTAALDKDTARVVLDMMRELAREAASAILMVTHDTRLLDAADRIVHMVDGRIVSNIQVRRVLDICRYLRQSQLFVGQTPMELTEIAEKMRLESHPTGMPVIRQGDPGDRFYLVRSGTLSVDMHEGTETRHVRALGPGDYFGERALLSKEARSATVTTREPCELWSLGKEDFEAAMAHSASFEDQILSGALRRM